MGYKVHKTHTDYDTFQSTVNGIPCIVKVNKHLVVPPYLGSPHDCPSDLDYYGYTEFEYNILDRKGYPASWLEDKLTSADDDRLLKEYEE
jgi:hypothetical protein